MALLLASCSGVRLEVCQTVQVGLTYHDDMRDADAKGAGGSCRVYEIRDAESP